MFGKRRSSADSELRVPSTESKTSFPAAPEPILETACRSPRAEMTMGDAAGRQKQDSPRRMSAPTVFAGTKERSAQRL